MKKDKIRISEKRTQQVNLVLKKTTIKGERVLTAPRV